MSQEAKDSSTPPQSKPPQSTPPKLQPNKPAEAQNEPRRPWWLNKKVVVALAVCGVVAAACLIVPQMARSASLERDLRQQLSAAASARNALEQELAKANAELVDAAGQIQSAEADVAAHELKVDAAEQFIDQLAEQLEVSQQANEQALAQLEAAERAGDEAKAEATQLGRRAQALSSELAAVQTDARKLREARLGRQAANTRLSGKLRYNLAESADLRRLVDALRFGEPQATLPEPSAWPGEKPITGKQLISFMGQPSVSFKKGRRVEMKWGRKHTAFAIDGIVIEIDGEVATHAVMMSAASYRPAAAPAPARWLAGRGERLHYADLVSMFGQPERVAGTGRLFTAWWTIGAWARRAHATVAEGVVTEFDGRPVDPAVCCELVRHRAQAYKTANVHVQIEVAVARDFYKQAAEIVAAELAKEADKLRRDGVTLRRWKLAPFDSVGAWIAPTNAPAGSMTLRATVDCTWALPDGGETTLRRYAVVRMVSTPEGQQRAEYAIFTGRD